jgi:hypothetical protein
MGDVGTSTTVTDGDAAVAKRSWDIVRFGVKDRGTAQARLLRETNASVEKKSTELTTNR